MSKWYYGLVMVCCLLFSMEGHTENKQIRLASSEYPPYFGEQLDNQGVITEIIVEAYTRIGYEVEIKFMPWARSLEMTKEGDFDGMFALWYREEREQWFAFSAPLPPNELGFYKRRDNPITFTRFEDLRGYRIGTCRGYANPPEFEQATYLRTEEVPSDEQNIQKVYHERVDLILIDKGLAQYLIATKFPEYQEELEWIEPALERVAQHLVLSKQVAAYQTKLNDFNEGLRLITEDGTLQRILTKHGF